MKMIIDANMLNTQTVSPGENNKEPTLSHPAMPATFIIFLFNLPGFVSDLFPFLLSLDAALLFFSLQINDTEDETCLYLSRSLSLCLSV